MNTFLKGPISVKMNHFIFKTPIIGREIKPKLQTEEENGEKKSILNRKDENLNLRNHFNECRHLHLPIHGKKLSN